MCVENLDRALGIVIERRADQMLDDDGRSLRGVDEEGDDGGVTVERPAVEATGQLLLDEQPLKRRRELSLESRLAGGDHRGVAGFRGEQRVRDDAAGFEILKKERRTYHVCSINARLADGYPVTT